MAKRLAGFVLALVLAAFFAFVGWNKAFASLADLASYHAWTIWLPEALGRIVGWSEMACAVLLLIPRTRPWAALLLIANQLVAAGFHAAHGEAAALPQNAVLIAMLAFIARPVSTARGDLK